MIEVIPYILLLMTFWDFSIHVIDKRDRKYNLRGEGVKMWSQRLKRSKLFFSYYYPHFWGKKPVANEKAWKRYDYFWLIYWGTATTLLAIYIVFR